jgi:hypothetical protein
MQNMKHKDFKQAKQWIVKDIRREVTLAYAEKNEEHKALLAKTTSARRSPTLSGRYDRRGRHR